MRFNLESASPSLTNIDNAGILARSLQHPLAARRQPLQMHTRGFVGTVLTPHHAENSELGKSRFTRPQKLLDLLVFFGTNAMLPEDLRRKGRGHGSGHGEIYCRIYRARWVGLIFSAIAWLDGRGRRDESPQSAVPSCFFVPL